MTLRDWLRLSDYRDPLYWGCRFVNDVTGHIIYVLDMGANDYFLLDTAEHRVLPAATAGDVLEYTAGGDVEVIDLAWERPE